MTTLKLLIADRMVSGQLKRKIRFLAIGVAGQFRDRSWACSISVIEANHRSLLSSRRAFASKLDDLDPSANFASILDQIMSAIRTDPLNLHRMLTIDACYQIDENALIVVCVLVRQFSRFRH
jgi:hypothetical protein